MTQSILIVDDEADIRDILADIFVDEGYDVHRAAHSEQALSLIKSHKPDLIVLDIWLDNSDMDGIQILKHLKSSDYKNIPILMISGHGNVEMAVNAMKVGAFDFIEKPFKIDHILLTVNRALEQKTLKEENSRLKGQDETKQIFKSNYKSAAMVALFKSIQSNSESDARVLIMGEKGTGKTYIAKIIHELSKRGKKKIESINCYDLELRNLIDSFAACHDGVIVIENVEMLNSEAQAELLSIITKSIYPCRIIATCDCSIQDKVKNQKFSSALLDRLSVLEYNVPSLEKRHEDIEILVKEFIEIFCNEFHIPQPTIPHMTLANIKSYNWQGNIRQLKIAVEWMMMAHYLNPDEDITFNQSAPPKKNEKSNIALYPSQDHDNSKIIFDLPLKLAREDFEKKYLLNMLDRFDRNIAKIAEHIDMERTALYRKLKSMDISYNDDTITRVNQ